MPSTPTSSDESCAPADAMVTTKRRQGAALPPLAPKSPHAFMQPFPHALSFVAGRRRRLFAYLAAFAVMLALSSMLDLRRAALNAKKSDRITLSMPPATGAAAHAAVAEPNHPAAQPAPVPLPVDGAATAAEVAKLPSDEHVAASAPDRKLSEQELKDDVDQLISHVEQEANANNTANANAAAAATSTSTSTTSTTTTTTTHVEDTASASAPSDAQANASPTASAPNATSVSVDGAAGATIEEQFADAQKLLDQAAKNDTLRPYIDMEELRTLRALGLQGARGDCEKAADPSLGGALFKTDAEAKGDDIEKTDALWGAWCVFSGRYRSDAMRDYVARARTLRARLALRAENDEAPVTRDFDETDATLNDVLSPNAQTALRLKAELVLPHLSENDARLLAALSMQATLGDCAPYARKKKRASGEAPLPRELVEPLFGRQATRGEGALWGAWCVFARRQRAAAADTLAERIDGFYRQLVDQTAALVANGTATEASGSAR